MKAMLLRRIGPITPDTPPLESAEIATPSPGPGDVLLRVLACGVCHTELDEIEGRTPPPRLPVVPGHQIVGRVESAGTDVEGIAVGARVGVGWIFSACGKCAFCRRGDDNLCSEFRATGRDTDGGYAERVTVPAESVFPVPDCFTDSQAAPLLCAGAIGYRSLRLTGVENGQTLGLTGFGASGHLVLKMVKHRFPDTAVYVFARSPSERAFARELGAVWTGDTAERAPVALRAIIDTTPVWLPVVKALENLQPGGRLVVNAIRKEDVDQTALLQLDYAEHLWMEKEIKSVANVSRRDIREFLELAAAIPIVPDVQEYALAEANRALVELKNRQIRGAKVLRMG